MPWTNIRAIQLQAIQAGTGQLCPRIELRPSNSAAAELALAAIKFGTDHPLWSKLFDLRSAMMRPRARVRLLYRIMEALANPVVAARIKAAREKATPKPKPAKRARRRR